MLYCYAERIDAGDLKGVAALFSNAEFLSAEGAVVAAGQDQLLAMLEAAVKIYPDSGTPGTKHVTSNVIVEVDESQDSASARSYFTVFQAAPGFPLQAIVAGRYHDEFSRVDDIWHFHKRRVIPELYGDVSHHLHYDPRK